MADSKAVLKIAELGLKGNKTELVIYLQQLAAQEANSNRRGLYNSIKDLLEVYKNEPILSTSNFDSEGLNVDLSSVWISPKVEQQINQFIRFYKNKDNAKSNTQLSHLNKLLLYGPPGTGKTTIGFYIGNQLNLPIKYVRIADVISSRFGETLKNIADLFNSPGTEVVFIDEFDAFAKSRSDSQDIGELKRIVNSIIQTLDFHSQNKVVIVATNLIDSLDSAITRRFAFKINVDYLTEIDAIAFLQFLTKKTGIRLQLSERESGFLISLAQLVTIDAIKMLVDKATVLAEIENKEKITFADLLVILVSEEHIRGAHLKYLKKENPLQLKEVAQILKGNGYTQEDIAGFFGIHRNSYNTYFS